MKAHSVCDLSFQPQRKSRRKSQQRLHFLFPRFNTPRCAGSLLGAVKRKTYDKQRSAIINSSELFDNNLETRLHQFQKAAASCDEQNRCLETEKLGGRRAGFRATVKTYSMAKSPAWNETFIPVVRFYSSQQKAREYMLSSKPVSQKYKESFSPLHAIADIGVRLVASATFGSPRTLPENRTHTMKDSVSHLKSETKVFLDFYGNQTIALAAPNEADESMKGPVRVGEIATESTTDETLRYRSKCSITITHGNVQLEITSEPAEQQHSTRSNRVGGLSTLKESQASFGDFCFDADAILQMRVSQTNKSILHMHRTGQRFDLQSRSELTVLRPRIHAPHYNFSPYWQLHHKKYMSPSVAHYIRYSATWSRRIRLLDRPCKEESAFEHSVSNMPPDCQSRERSMSNWLSGIVRYAHYYRSIFPRNDVSGDSYRVNASKKVCDVNRVKAQAGRFSYSTLLPEVTQHFCTELTLQR